MAMDAQAMTIASLVSHDLVGNALEAGSWLGAGVLIGALHFLTLRWNAAALVDDGPIALALAILIVRLAATGVLLTAVARFFGGPALLAATVGIVAARGAVLRWSEST
jgi:hypothetical protein